MAQESGPTSIELGGETSGWVGRAPESINGETNPTLELIPETNYEITWENVDGQPHNVVILDADGNQLERTELISERGQTQTLEFVATEEMSEYLCEVHPTSMRGDISLGTAAAETNESQSAANANQSAAETNESQPAVSERDPTGNESRAAGNRITPAETPAQTFEMDFENGAWTGRSPSSIDGQTNPTLDLETGQTYRVVWENRESIDDPSKQRPNFVLLSETEGVNTVLHSEYVVDKGATQTINFVATEDLEAYSADAYLDAQGEITTGSTEETRGQQQGGNGKAKQGNGKAKQGNGSS